MDPMTKFIERFRALGYTVEQFTVWHYRVNDQIDFWYPKGRWHDLITGERGKKPLDQMHSWIDTRIKSRTPQQIDKNNFIVNLLSIGWTKEDAEAAWQERSANNAR